MNDYVRGVCERARGTMYDMAAAQELSRNNALLNMAGALEDKANIAAIEEANATDYAAAQNGGTRPFMLDRLRFSGSRIAACAAACRDIASSRDPLGKGEVWRRPNGLEVRCVSVPLGVVGFIYEARPNVTVDAAAMAVKCGCPLVLRGGSDALGTNRVIVALIKKALSDAGLPEDAVCLVDDATRASSEALMKMRGLVDVLIPRGGRALIRSVCDNATVPVIETGAGNCHVYIDGGADIDTGVKIALNAKISRPSVCNSAESLLVCESVAAEFLPLFAEAAAQAGVELRCDAAALALIHGGNVSAAAEEDYYTEYNDLIYSVAVVRDVKAAAAHINKYSTHHSECIVTKSLAAADYFTAYVDSAAVYVNASTRFTDGGEFGFGAELGISTQKLHARGPLGLDALTSVKYIVRGDGQTR